MRSPFDSPQAMGSVNLRRLPGGFHSVAKQASFNIAFGVDLGGFGRPKSMPKFDFRAIFSDVIVEKKNYIEILFIFGGSKPEKIAIFHWKNNDFHKIGFFDKDPKNNEISCHFRRPKRKKIQ